MSLQNSFYSALQYYMLILYKRSNVIIKNHFSEKLHVKIFLLQAQTNLSDCHKLVLKNHKQYFRIINAVSYCMMNHNPFYTVFFKVCKCSDFPLCINILFLWRAGSSWQDVGFDIFVAMICKGLPTILIVNCSVKIIFQSP